MLKVKKIINQLVFQSSTRMENETDVNKVAFSKKQNLATLIITTLFYRVC